MGHLQRSLLGIPLAFQKLLSLLTLHSTLFLPALAATVEKHASCCGASYNTNSGDTN